MEQFDNETMEQFGNLTMSPNKNIADKIDYHEVAIPSPRVSS